MLYEEEFYKFLKDEGQDWESMYSGKLELLKACWEGGVRAIANKLMKVLDE